MQEKLRVRTEPAFPIATIKLVGTLDLDTAVIVRNALRKHMADQPAALVLDLSGLVVERAAALSVLRTALRSASEVPGIPLILLVPDDGLREQLRRSGMDRQAPLVAARDTAIDLAMSMEAPLRRVLRQLPCKPTSLREARQVARDLCVSWGITAAKDAVVLVVCELVTNAVEHARTPFDVTVALRGRYVHVAVRDGSPQPPRREEPDGPAGPGGRGLLLVDELTAAWGHVPVHGGKLVWATVLAS